MSDITKVLHQIDEGDSLAAEKLFPLVYEELRRLAAQKMVQEQPGHTLQATALVHESYIRLVDSTSAGQWKSRQHFFAAAARAMRQILVDRARRKKAVKHGGHLQRVDLVADRIAHPDHPEDLLALDTALTELEQHSPEAVRLIELRFFSGLTHQEAAESLGLQRRAADRLWALARAWLFRRIGEEA